MDTHDAYRVLGKDDSTLDGGPDTRGKLQALGKQLGLVAPHPVRVIGFLPVSEANLYVGPCFCQPLQGLMLNYTTCTQILCGTLLSQRTCTFSS